MGKKIIITGATGMVGSHLLAYCLEHKEVEKVISLVRKPSGKSAPKLEEIIITDFLNYAPGQVDFENTDIAFFCIGVYTGAVPRDTFREITVDYPVALAKALYQHSPQASFCLLSGSGADRSERSRMIFAKDKGAAENQLAAIGFKAFHTFRPAYIYPVIPRKEPNAMYSISRTLYPLIKLFGDSASIKSTELAQAMLHVGMQGSSLEVLENKDILEQL